MSIETPPSVQFANTVHAVRGKQQDALPTWLERHEHPADPDTTAEFAVVRDAVRSLIDASVVGEAYPPEAIAIVNAASAAAPFWTTLNGGEDGALGMSEQTGATGVVAELGAIARDAISLLGSPDRLADREALRACQAPGCLQYFVKTHPRQEFCGPVCGNRARAARHYARHKED